jgi:hypothetical protein
LACGREIATLRWSVVGWVTTKKGRHVKPVAPAAFAVVNTYQPALGTLLTCNL